jgi:hypothetical protein
MMGFLRPFAFRRTVFFDEAFLRPRGFFMRRS